MCVHRIRIAFAFAAFSFLAPNLAAEGEDAAELRKDNVIFDVMVLGIQVGSMTMAAQANENSYGASAVLKPNSLVRIFTKYNDVKYVASAQGWLRGNGFEPVRYAEIANTGSRVSEVEIKYRNGVPEDVVYSPPRERTETDVDPLSQGGSIDPMTAFYIVLRDVKTEELCDIEFSMFDGRRQSKVLIEPPVWSRGNATCSASYVRVAGFSERETSERTEFPITFKYRPRKGGAGWFELFELETESRFGSLSARRR